MNKSKKNKKLDYNKFENSLIKFTKFVYKDKLDINAPLEIEKFYCVEDMIDLIKDYCDSKIIRFSDKNIYLAKWEDKAFAFYDSKHSVDEAELSVSLLLSESNISQMQIRAVEDLDKNMMPLLSDIEIFVGKYTRRVLNEKNQRLVCPSTIAHVIKQFPHFTAELEHGSVIITPLVDSEKSESALITYDNSYKLNEAKIINQILDEHNYKTVFLRSVGFLEKILNNN